MATLTASQLARIMPRARDPRTWTDVLCASMQEFAIDSAPRAAAFLAQVACESGELCVLVENLDYSAAALRATWPRRFDSDGLAGQYARQPEKIANFVYANRLGNGDQASGDGWRFRGRGLLQMTGRSQYRTCGASLGLALEDQPDLLAQAGPAARSAGLYWAHAGLNALADASADRVHDDEDFVRITQRINGGTTGLAQRKAYWSVAKQVLGVA